MIMSTGRVDEGSSRHYCGAGKSLVLRIAAFVMCAVKGVCASVETPK